ncbi:MAG TPA: hypothetical protein VE338_00445 [Ktedonobacterales bacterium]|jgi:hypothetical protein|nr:hypothetical protein [Ktedonobacterales bacterium]
MALTTPPRVAHLAAANVANATQKRSVGLRATIVALEAFIATTAISGAIFVLPTIPAEWLQRGLITPFTDTTIPALALGVLCGGSALAAMVAVAFRPRLGALLAMLSGVIMVGFELVEIVVVGFTPLLYPTQPPAWLQPFYIALGLAVAALGARLWKQQTGSWRIRRASR